MIQRASIATTATNSAIGFTLIGLVSTVAFLMANAALVFTTLTNIKPPDIKQVIVSGLEDGPIKLYLDLEFPKTSGGNLISAQTEGPINVSVFITERGKTKSDIPSLSAEIPSGVNLNLASNEPTRLIIDDLEIKLGESFDSGMISKLATAKLANNLKPEMLPNIDVKIDTRVVFKSLWIPLGAAVDMPLKFDLSEMMKKSLEKENKEKEKKDETKNEKKEEVPKILSLRDIEKQNAIKEFNFKPRTVKVSASDSDKLEIAAIVALPAAMVPDFLSVEVPEVKLQANFYQLHTEADVMPIKFVEFGTRSFLLEPAPMDNVNSEINFVAKLKIDKSDVNSVRKILELVRDEKKYKIGVQIKPSDEFIAGKKPGGLLHWLRDFSIDIPVGDILKKSDDEKKADEKKKAEEAQKAEKEKIAAEAKEAEKAEKSDANKAENPKNPDEKTDIKKAEEVEAGEKKVGTEKKKAEEAKTEGKGVVIAGATEQKQNTIVKAKLLQAEKTPNGGKFKYQIVILHSVVDFLVGNLPVIDFQTVLNDGTKLLGIKISSNQITQNSETIEINFELEINNLKQAIYAGLLLSKMGTEEMHKQLPEVRAIKGLRVEFTSDNVISKLASVFNLDVLFGDKGIDKIKFQNSETVLYPKPETEKKESNEKTKKDETQTNSPKKNLEFFAKFAIQNDGKENETSKNVRLGASVDLEEVPYSGDVAHASWKNFDLSMNYMKKPLFIFKIYEGAAMIGLTNGVKPIYASFATGISIPANDEDLIHLKNFLKSLIHSEKDILHLEFEIKYGEVTDGKTGKISPILLDASIPCKNLLIAKKVEVESDKTEGKDKKALTDKQAETGDEKTSADKAKESSDKKTDDKPTDSDKKTDDKPTDSDKKTDDKPTDSDKKTDDKPTDSDKKTTDKSADDEKSSNKTENSKSDERTDFVGKAKNSIISFVSFHATTLFFHVNYPNGEYCKQADDKSEFDIKINFEMVLPMIEANVCSKDDIEAELKCFASGGLSRPMKLSGKIIDGQVCKVESLILPQENALYNDPTFKVLNSYKYENNEVPVHVSVKNLPDLVRFADMVGAKRKQFLTVGPVDTATTVNKFIGVFVSSVFEYEFKQEEEEKGKEKKVKKITVFHKPETPALIDIRAASATINELEFMVNFKLPESALLGIPKVTGTDNRFEWPAVRWGTFGYSFGVDKLFEFSLAINRGQVDLHSDGIVIPALNDFAVRVKFKTDESVQLGSTNLRLIIGTLKKYFDKSKEHHLMDSDFLRDVNDRKFYYKFTMENPRELNEGIKFFSEGHVIVKDMLDVFDAIINREKLPGTEGNNQKNNVVIADPHDKNPFKDLRITIKKEDQENKSTIRLPCLIPALCPNEPTDHNDGNGGVPMKFIFELENLLTPATELIGSKLGPVLRNFKMADYPSSLKFSVALLSDVWITMVLDGAGLASVGLSRKTTKFSRSISIDYGSDVTTFVQKEAVKLVDKLDLPLQFRFPKTIIGLRKTLAAFRKEAIMVPPVPPVYYVQSDTGELSRLILTNPALMISLSSDDRYEPGSEQNNLLSAVIAAVLPEMNVGSINPDFLLDMLYKKYEYTKPVKENEKKEGEGKENGKLPETSTGKTTEETTDSHKGTPKETSTDISTEKLDEGSKNDIKKVAQVDEKDGTVSERGSVGNGDLVAFATCFFSRICYQFDMNYNIKLKFAVKLLRLILPNTAIFRLITDRSTFFQFTADARKQQAFEVSDENGLDFLGTASINLAGLSELKEGEGTTALDLIRGKEKDPKIKLQVIVGHDIDFNADLNFPFYIIGSYLNLSVGEQIDKMIKNSPLGFLSFSIPKLFDDGIKYEDLVVAPVGNFQKPERAELLEVRPQMRECVDDEIKPDAKKERIKKLNYAKSAIYFEKGNEVLEVGKSTKIYLQLRTDNEEVVCGQPIGAKNLKIQFIREEKEQGFVKLVNFLSFKAPESTLVVDASSLTFNHLYNLFVIDVKFSYPGRYKIKVKDVKIKKKDQENETLGEAELEHAFLYVKNDY